MLVRTLRAGAVEIVMKLGPEIRVRTDIDDFPGALERRSAPQVRIAVFRYEKMDIMLCMIYMRDEWNDAGKRAVFRSGRRHEDRKPRVLGKITAAADAVHQIDPGYVR